MINTWESNGCCRCACVCNRWTHRRCDDGGVQDRHYVKIKIKNKIQQKQTAYFTLFVFHHGIFLPCVCVQKCAVFDSFFIIIISLFPLSRRIEFYVSDFFFVGRIETTYIVSRVSSIYYVELVLANVIVDRRSAAGCSAIQLFYLFCCFRIIFYLKKKQKISACVFRFILNSVWLTIKFKCYGIF